MLIDRAHKSWIVFVLAALVLCVGHYAWYQQASYRGGGNGPSGGSWTGLAYGILGLGVMLFCGLLGVRRRVRTWRLGRATTWLRAHIWLGLLAFPLILFHSGMRWGNHLTWWLMTLFLIVEVTGIVGLILQNSLPRYMLSRLPAEATFEQIPHLVSILRGEADELVGETCGPLTPAIEGEHAGEADLPGAGGAAVMKTDGPLKGKVVHKKKKGVGPVEGSEPLRAFYLNQVRPFLGLAFLSRHRLALPQSSLALFEHTRTLIPEALHETLRDLESICEERRQMAFQQRLHFWLHCWLFAHVPLSYALLLLSIFHAVEATLKY